MPSKEHHVVPNKSGWAVKRNGASRSSGCYDTQAKAIKAGRTMSRNQGTELVIHGKDGRIRAKDSHGNDPFPPKG